MSVTARVDPEPVVPEPAGGEAQQALGGGLGVQLVRVFAENRLAIVGLGVIVFAILFCWVGPLIYHTNQTDSSAALASTPGPNSPPSAEHLLGTDPSGFDMLGRIMYGGQISLLVGFAAAIMATVLGVLVGAVS